MRPIDKKQENAIFFIKFPPIRHTSLLFYDDDDDDDDKDGDDDVRSFFRWHGCCRLLMRRPRGPKCHFHDASPAACHNTHFFHDQHFGKRKKNINITQNFTSMTLPLLPAIILTFFMISILEKEKKILTSPKILLP